MKIKNRKCNQTIPFDLRGVLEIPVIVIWRVDHIVFLASVVLTFV